MRAPKNIREGKVDRMARTPGLYVLFDGPPGHLSGRFVEVEDQDGNGASVGWLNEGDFWALGPFVRAEVVASYDRVQAYGESIEQIVYAVEARCMATDGPVTPTLQEMTEPELREIWLAAHKIVELIHRKG